MNPICCADNSLFDAHDEDDDIVEEFLPDVKPNPDIKEIQTTYNLNPPLLYLLIESQDWDEVLSRCASNPEEIGAWVSCKVPNTDTYRWHHLPIHAALVLKADIRVIKALVSPFPISAQRKDIQGRLPCHLAIQHDASEEILDYLIKLYPESMSITDNKGRVPLAWIFEAEEPRVGLRSSIAIYLNIERNKTKEEQELIMSNKLNQFKAQYDENISWLKDEREKDKFDMEERIKEFQEETDEANARLRDYLESKDNLSDDVAASKMKIEDLEQSLSSCEKELLESQQKVKTLEETLAAKSKSRNEDIKFEMEKINLNLEELKLSNEELNGQLVMKISLLKRNQQKNIELSDDLAAAREKIKDLETQLETCISNHEREIQDLKKHIQASDAIKATMKERLAKLTSSLVNIEYDSQRQERLKQNDGHEQLRNSLRDMFDSKDDEQNRNRE